ncbi:MAG TPA: M23 family metallopeptidase [Cytophagales bacterium]|nr:M23 family metallopeptidase [Cytophagales bacterium]
MKNISITFIALTLISIQSVFSQSFFRSKKQNSITIPKVIDIRVDTALKLQQNDNLYLSRIAELPDEYDTENFYDEEEDDESTGGGYLSPEEISSEELAIDSAWFKMFDYYSVWDSKNVNPYGIDGKSFHDTLNIVLYDSMNSWASPINSQTVTSKFGFRRYRWHYGTDLKLNVGDSVSSVFDGIVRIAKYDRRGYGNYVLIRHNNGLETLYGHLSKTNVVVGQVVKAGEVIGLGGNTGRSTGPHLHFEVRYQGNPIDPVHLFDFETASLNSDQFTLTPSHFSYLKEVKKVRFHKIRRGDTLSEISKRYGVSMTKICRLNNISKRTTLRVGRKLRVY